MILYTTKIPLETGTWIMGGDEDGDLLESSYVEVNVTNISEEADGNRRVYYRCNLYTGRKNGKGKAIYNVTLTGFNNDEKKEIEISEGLSLVATGEGSAIDTAADKEYWGDIICGARLAAITIDAEVFLVNNDWSKVYGMSLQQKATIATMPIGSIGQTTDDLHYGVPFDFSASGDDADSCKIDFFINDEKVYSKSIDSLSGEITVPAEVYKTYKKDINKEKITYYKNGVQVFRNPYQSKKIKETEATISTIAKRESESSAVVNVECFGNLAAISTSYTIKVYYKETSAEEWIEGKTYIGTSNDSSTTYDVTITLTELSIDYAYDIYAIIDDGYTSAKSINSRVYSKQYIMDVRTDGKGIAFGGTAANEDEMYCGFETFRANNIKANGSVYDSGGNLRLAIPIKVSELENDTGYVTKDAIPIKVSELENDTGYVNATSGTFSGNVSGKSLSSSGNVTAQSMELSFSTPFIDFHYGNGSSDYDTRIINDASGRLSVMGNLNVTGGLTVGGKTIFDLIYPVGSIYMSVNSTSPATLFGGTWERIQDRFLLAAGSTYAAGGMDGEATHTLKVEELPSHAHPTNDGNQYITMPATGASPARKHVKGDSSSSIYALCSADNPIYRKDAPSAGGGGAHNNMPPYLTVYVWKRTA